MIRRWLAPVCCALVAMGLVATCASGGSRLNGGDDDDDDPVHDAPKQPDASNVVVDASLPVDAKLPDAAILPPDAPPDAPVSSLFCTTNSMCTNSGECCLTLGGPQGFCAPGVVIAGVCFPQ